MQIFFDTILRGEKIQHVILNPRNRWRMHNMELVKVEYIMIGKLKSYSQLIARYTRTSYIRTDVIWPWTLFRSIIHNTGINHFKQVLYFPGLCVEGLCVEVCQPLSSMAGWRLDSRAPPSMNVESFMTWRGPVLLAEYPGEMEQGSSVPVS